VKRFFYFIFTFEKMFGNFSCLILPLLLSFLLFFKVWMKLFSKEWILCPWIWILSSLFDSTCQSVLDIVGPFKVMSSKPKSEPWLNDTTRAVR